MANVIFKLFCILIFIYAEGTQGKEETVFIHTDNWADFSFFQQQNKELPSLSAKTNKLVFEQSKWPVRFEYMSLKRSLKFISAGENVCVVDKIKTEEREKEYLFSLPINVFLSRQLYQQTYLPKLNKEPVDLGKLFAKQKRHKILLTSQITYGEVLERQLLAISEEQKIYRNSSEHAQGIADMFISGRAEYALFYPQVLKELTGTINARAYEIANVRPYVVGYLMCANNSSTRNYLQQIDGAIIELHKVDKLLDLHLQHVDDINKPRFMQYFRSVLESVEQEL